MLKNNLNIAIAVFFLVLFSISAYGNNPLLQLNELNSKFDSFNSFFISDTLNQTRISSTSNDFYHNLTLNKIPLFSLFDGNYNFIFLKNYLCENNNDANFNCDSLYLIKDTLISNVLLYSGNKNGMLNGFHLGKEKNFFWKFNPIFESSGGYYYSTASKEKPLREEFLENSAYQNIGINAEFGFEGRKSKISLASSFNISKLYIPTNINVFNSVKKHFNDYNEYIIDVKFENSFENNITLNGNIFAKKLFRNLGSTIDSNVIKFGIYVTNFEIDEYSYGGNLNTTLPIFSSQKNTLVSFLYEQNVFLYTNFSKYFRSRTESENIELSILQSFLLTDNFDINFEGKFKERAVLYSELGTLPGNSSSIDYKVTLNYNITNSQKFTFFFKKYNFFPFISQYYNLEEEQFGNHRLRDENWYLFCFSYDNRLDNFNFKIELQSNFGNNIFNSAKNIKYSTQDLVYEQIKNLSSAIELKYKLESLKIINNIAYFWKIDYSENTKINPNYKLPSFADKFLINYQFLYGISASININYFGKFDIYDPKINKINGTENIFLLDFIMQKDFSNQYFFFALNNILNNYYELQSGIPEAGLNFQLGVKLNF